MFWKELKKTWKRPEMLIVLLVLCVVQMVQVWNCIPAQEQAYRAAYRKYGGTMDAAWKEKINSAFDAYMSNEKNLKTEQEYRENLEAYGIDADSEDAVDPFFLLTDDAYYLPEFQVLHKAWCYTGFHDLANNFIRAYQQGMAATDAKYDTGRIADAYAEVKAQSEHFIFDDDATRVVMAGSLKTFAEYILILLVLLLAPLFTRERDTGMDALIDTSKNGKRKLNRIKFAVCQSSALMIAVILLGLTAITIGIRTGWQGMDAVVQDFRQGYNTCPFAWNNGQYLAVILVVSLVACQVAAMVVFVLAQHLRSNVKIICIALGVLLVPILMFNSFPSEPLALYFSNFINGEYLWSSYGAYRIGTIYVQMWQIALTELAVVAGVTLLFIVRKNRQDWSSRKAVKNGMKFQGALRRSRDERFTNI